ncbi:MAG: hypothetical protein ABI723_13665 [Bacteroidia bacterium]
MEIRKYGNMEIWKYDGAKLEFKKISGLWIKDKPIPVATQGYYCHAAAQTTNRNMKP